LEKLEKIQRKISAVSLFGRFYRFEFDKIEIFQILFSNRFHF